MNIREGMRRVGIVLGALGCVAGGGLGYWSLQEVWRAHTRFERLQALPVMLDLNAAIKDFHQVQIDPRTGERIPDKIVEVPGVGSVSFPGGMSDDKIAEAITSYLAQHKIQQVPPPPPGYTLDRPAVPPPPLPPGATLVPDFIPEYAASTRAAYPHDKAVADDPAAEFTVDVKGTDGIQTVNADKSGAISSIQLTTGEWVHRGAKTLKARLGFIASLLLPFCYPVIGFLVPWGTIRVFVWVAGGFSAPQSTS